MILNDNTPYLHETQNNNNQDNDIQHNNSQHHRLVFDMKITLSITDTQHTNVLHYAELC